LKLNTSKPNAVVIGLGQYFNKLKSGLDEYFNIVQLIDSAPIDNLNLNPIEASNFEQFSMQNELKINEDTDCFFILTPPASHIFYLKLLEKYKKSILVEKPLVISPIEIDQVREIIKNNPRIYCSDFYPDVRAIPLLQWFFPERNFSLWKFVGFARGSKRVWEMAPSRFGKIKKIEGKLLEGQGSARSFNGREWLWDPVQGGVLLDLLYHYLTLSSFLFDKDFTIDNAILKTLGENGALVNWEETMGKSETYANVKGRLNQKISVDFEVGKYYGDVNERYYKILFDFGTAVMLFRKPNILYLNYKGEECEICLCGDYYKHVSLNFNKFVSTSRDEPYGLKHAIRAMETLDSIKFCIFRK
jgi:predicted dehydrogenase